LEIALAGRFVGPLGIWPYPVLNLILEFFEGVRAGRGGLGASTLRTTTKNIEKIRWTDYKGHDRTLVIEREVKS